MAIILPLIGAIFVPGVLPALALGFFVMALAFYRYKIEKYQDESTENINENAQLSKEIDTESCQNCSCGKKEKSCEEPNKINKITILYGTTTGNSKDFAWKLAKEAEEEGFEIDVNNVANIDAEEFLPQQASNDK